MSTEFKTVLPMGFKLLWLALIGWAIVYQKAALIRIFLCVYHTIIRAAFVCLFVCLFVPYVLRGHLTDLRQTWWVYVG